MMFLDSMTSFSNDKMSTILAAPLKCMQPCNQQLFLPLQVTLSEKYLVSVCSEYNHVRSWRVTRFRGMLSTQPGSTPEASFKIVALEAAEPNLGIIGGACGLPLASIAGNDCGPFGEQDDEQVFVQKVVPDADQLFVRLASNGKRSVKLKEFQLVDFTSQISECALLKR